MTIQVLMPQFGESVVEGTITRWLKNPGELVEEFEPLVEVNTDKVDTEVPSPASGRLVEIVVSEGTVAQAGQVLALIEESPPIKEQMSPVAHMEEALDEIDEASVPVKPGRNHELGFISPVVAKLASEYQVDLHQVKGSGQNGRITKQDVLSFIKETGQAKLEKRAGGEPALAEIAYQPERMVSTDQKLPQKPEIITPATEGEQIIPLTPVRRAIAEHMVLSKRTSPHVTTVMEVDLSRVVAHRQANLELYAQDGVKLTYTPYFITAVVTALKAYPIVNSSWSESGIIIHKIISIGMATSLGEGGLIVPVIKHADTLSLLGLARLVNDLANRARNRQLKPDEVQGGTFTITNHGISGSLFATPIINQPQCGILGIGAIQKRVIVIEDAQGNEAIGIHPMAYLSFTFDHRILDGVIADNFLAKVVESLRNFS